MKCSTHICKAVISFVNNRLSRVPNESINCHTLHCFSEGTSSDDPLLGRYSNTVNNMVLESTSGSMYLYMTTDCDVTFLADYSIAGTLTFVGD